MKQDAARAKGSHTILYLLIAAMVLFWSANYIIGKVALREFPPLLAGGLRVAMAGVFMLPVPRPGTLRAVEGKADTPAGVEHALTAAVARLRVVIQ